MTILVLSYSNTTMLYTIINALPLHCLAQAGTVKKQTKTANKYQCQFISGLEYNSISMQAFICVHIVCQNSKTCSYLSRSTAISWRLSILSNTVMNYTIGKLGFNDCLAF